MKWYNRETSCVQIHRVQSRVYVMGLADCVHVGLYTHWCWHMVRYVRCCRHDYLPWLFQYPLVQHWRHNQLHFVCQRLGWFVEDCLDCQTSGCDFLVCYSWSWFWISITITCMDRKILKVNLVSFIFMFNSLLYPYDNDKHNQRYNNNG